MFLIAEAIILPLALVIAILRGLSGPVFFPIRLLAVVYVDFFRGIPTILLVLPARLRRPGAAALLAAVDASSSGPPSR